MHGFKDDEVVQVQGRRFPVVGGRLRLAHEGNERLAIRTELVKVEVDQVAIVRAIVMTPKGEFTGTGVATVTRDVRLADALVELAETRAIARALRFAGYGVETCGVEELAGDLAANPGAATGAGEQRLRVLAGGKPAETRQQDAVNSGSGRSLQKEEGRRPGNGNGTGGNGNRGLTVATAAQLRAIRTLARQVGTSPEAACTDKYGHGRVEGLTVREASGLIDDLKGQAGQPVA